MTVSSSPSSLRVLITGASSGIGEATAARFRANGDRVFLTGRRAESPRSMGDKETYLSGDLEDQDFVKELIDTVVGEFEEIDVLVLCHGMQRDAPIIDMASADAANVLDANLFSVFSVVKNALPHLNRDRGSVVCVSSRLGMVGMAGQVLYSAAKGGLIMFAKALAIELAREGVRVNVVAPGLTLTPKIQSSFAQKDDPEAYLEQRGDNIPIGRLATPEEIADPIYFLASSASSYITGVVLPIDGGYTAA